MLFVVFFFWAVIILYESRYYYHMLRQSSLHHLFLVSILYINFCNICIELGCRRTLFGLFINHVIIGLVVSELWLPAGVWQPLYLCEQDSAWSWVSHFSFQSTRSSRCDTSLHMYRVRFDVQSLNRIVLLMWVSSVITFYWQYRW